MAETTVNLGMLPQNRGEYSSSATYYKDNIVQYNGSSYICTAAMDLEHPSGIIGVAPYDSDPATPNTGWAVFSNDSSGVGEGVYNVSVDHTTDNQPKVYANLSAALNDIPAAKQKGGMSIKFIQGTVQNNDNKYVQFRFLLSGSFTDAQFIDTENWAITTEYIITDNPEYIKVVLGDDDSIIYAVKPNGDIIFGVGVPSEIRAYILAQIESSVEGKVDKVNGKGLSTNDFTNSLRAKLNALPTAEGLSMLFAEKVSKEEDKGIVPLQYFKEVDDFRYVKAVTDAEDNLLLAIDKNGYLVFGAGVPPQIVDYITSMLAAKVDKETGKVLISEQYATSVEVIDDPEWMQVTTDNTGNIIEGIKKDGSKYIAKLEGLKKESDIADYDFVKKQEGVNVEKRLIPYTVSTDEDVVNFSNHYNSLIIAFMTDSHIDINNGPSRENFKDTVDYVNSIHVPVAAILCGGDILTPTANSSDQRAAELRDAFALVNDSQIPFLYTKGNHDLNAISVAPSKVMTDDQWNSVYFDGAETKYGIVRNTKSNGKKSGYYYYDIPEHKVRIVCADCYDIDFSVTNSEGRVLYTPGDASYIANEQFNWIANTAFNFDDKDEKDWGVLVFMHFYRASDVWGTSKEPKFKAVYPAFNDMLVALNSQTAFSEQYTFADNSFFNLDVSADYTRYANLEKKPYVIGVICGHLHLDINYTKDGIQNIFTANQFCEIAESLTDQRVNRIAGTTTQNLFDLFAIDLHNKKIRAIRYGAGVNCYGNGGDRFLPNGLSF